MDVVICFPCSFRDICFTDIPIAQRGKWQCEALTKGFYTVKATEDFKGHTMPHSPDNRIPPFDSPAECAVLGAMMLSRGACDPAFDLLRAGDFYLAAHRTIFQTMHALYADSQPIDLVTLSAALRDAGQLEAVGGYDYLAGISDFVPSLSNIRPYVLIVQSLSRRRQMIQAAGSITELCFTEEDYLVIADTAQQAISRIGAGEQQPVLTMGQAVNDTIEQIEINCLPDNPHRIKTFFPDLDQIIGELRRKELTVLAARPGMGKTAFALNMVQRLAQQSGLRSGFISLEMDYKELTQRLIANAGRVSTQRMRAGTLREDEVQRIVEAGDVIGQYNMVINDDPNQTLPSIKAFVRQHQVDLLVIDYLQLLVKGQGENRNIEVGNITRTIKLMAKELDVHILLLSQLSRATEQRNNKRPRLSDLRDSGSIEQDADMVWGLYRDSAYRDDRDDPDTEVLVLKSRATRTGKVVLGFNGAYNLFYEM